MNAKNHLAAALLAAAAIMAITASASAQTTIRCPGEQMRKEIVPPLPGGLVADPGGEPPDRHPHRQDRRR